MSRELSSWRKSYPINKKKTPALTDAQYAAVVELIRALTTVSTQIMTGAAAAKKTTKHTDDTAPTNIEQAVIERLEERWPSSRLAKALPNDPSPDEVRRMKACFEMAARRWTCGYRTICLGEDCPCACYYSWFHEFHPLVWSHLSRQTGITLEEAERIEHEYEMSRAVAGEPAPSESNQ